MRGGWRHQNSDSVQEFFLNFPANEATVTNHTAKRFPPTIPLRAFVDVGKSAASIIETRTRRIKNITQEMRAHFKKAYRCGPAIRSRPDPISTTRVLRNTAR